MPQPNDNSDAAKNITELGHLADCAADTEVFDDSAQVPAANEESMRQQDDPHDQQRWMFARVDHDVYPQAPVGLSSSAVWLTPRQASAWLHHRLTSAGDWNALQFEREGDLKNKRHQLYNRGKFYLANTRDFDVGTFYRVSRCFLHDSRSHYVILI
jgi:hypothetical protein